MVTSRVKNTFSSKVQTVLRKAYVRAALRRNPNHRYTWKCRTTRASQTSTYVSNCDTSVTETAMVRPGAGPRSVHLLREVRTYEKGGLRKYGGGRSDEAYFWLNGYVKKQNCRIWSEANPQMYVETPLHPEKLTVWCALWAGGILLQKR
ncbi:corticotropin-releasing factor receptor 1 [Trichonephila clavipes]|nr:corticotropin-releasing factor receptor 1 [Trichonephila clavipes]